MSEDLRGDVRWEAGAQGVGGEQPAKIVWGEHQRVVRCVGQAGGGEQVVEVAADDGAGYDVVFWAALALEQVRQGRTPGSFVWVVGGDQGQRLPPVGLGGAESAIARGR